MESIEPYTDCCDVTTYYAEATSTARAYTSTGELVTSTSSATATSHVSYDDALETAQKIADEVAQSNADHDANVIDEAVTIANGNNDDVVVLENLSSTDNDYEIKDNTDIIYIKGSSGNATDLPDQIFPLGNITDVSLDSGIFSFEKDNSGNIYAGGAFAYTSTTGIQLNGVGKWDGSVWNSLNNGFFYSDTSGARVSSLKMDNNGNLYAGGVFIKTYDSSAVTLNNIAKWDGSKWNALGTGLTNSSSSSVSTIVFDSSNNLYVGGNFTTAGSTTASNIAKWDGTSWSDITGSNTTFGIVSTLSIDSSNNLYVGGSFTSIGGLTNANNIAKYDISTSTWSKLPTVAQAGVSGTAIINGSTILATVNTSLIDSSNNLYVGGFFTTAGTVTDVNGIAKWNGTSWSAVGSNKGLMTEGGVSGFIRALKFDSYNNLIIGGYFQKLGDSSKSIYNIAKYDGTNWNSIGGGIYGTISQSSAVITVNSIRSLLLSDSNEIIIGSSLSTIPYNPYFYSPSYIFKISNSYVNLNYNDVKLITQYYDGQSTAIKTVKNNITNKKVGYVYPNSYNVTETFV